MAVSANYFLDAATLSGATAVFTDATLTTAAADGWCGRRLSVPHCRPCAALGSHLQALFGPLCMPLHIICNLSAMHSEFVMNPVGFFTLA